MGESVWEVTHSVECAAPRESAWNYWTNPQNWDDPPARFAFDGPFAVGTRLTTLLPGQKLESTIREIVCGSEALIEMDLARATVQFRWRFEALGKQRTRITQTISLGGREGASLVEQAKVLEQSVPHGMRKLAAAIERQWASEPGTG
ncbi:MAG TPA: hypothetical protein VKB24_10715 [Candidatus Acidoferrum sp.]|nr:hypothetical protein [Candidatus Acidoferrum sp.]